MATIMSVPAQKKVTQINQTPSVDVSFHLGRRLDGAQNAISHSMAKAPNFHHALIGTSGAGKTFTIRNLAIEFASQGVTQFILDTQGDYAAMEFAQNHDLKGVRVNEIKFGYGPGTAGLNPFAIHSTDEQGGYHHAIIGVLETIRLFNPAVGARQKTLLRKLVNNTYERKGIRSDQPATWQFEPPTMRDLLRTIEDEIKSTTLRSDATLYDDIEDLRKSAKKSAKQLRDGNVSDNKAQDLREDIQTARQTIIEKFEKLIDFEINDDAKLPSNSSALNRLESIHDMIEGVIVSGLFDGEQIRPKRHAINVLDLTSLNQIDQQPVFYLLLEKTFHSAVRNCVQLNPSIPDMMFGFDEVKLFTAMADSPLDPINRFFTEGRKYGLGSLCGLQHAKQLTEEMRSSIGTLLLLPVAKEKVVDIKRIWGIPEQQMTRLRPKSDAFYGFGSQDFVPIKLFG
jgi:hypothetical protein